MQRYSLVMSARANGLEPYAYLRHLFDHLPQATTIENLEALLPWSAKAALQPRMHQQPQESIQPPPSERRHLALPRC